MHTDAFSAAASKNASPCSIALVGYSGRMGTMLARAWREAGHTVTGLGCRPGTTVDAEPLADADIVMLALPVSALCDVLERLAPFFRPRHLLMDLTSVKLLPMALMREFHTGPVIGTHPLFGPNPRSEELRTVLVAGRQASLAVRNKAENLFTSIGSSVFWASAREHDRGVAFAQSLNFAMSAAFFSTIARHPECTPFLTPSFRRHMEAARTHLTQDAAMFCEFTSRNPCFPEAIEAYRERLQQAAHVLHELAARGCRLVRRRPLTPAPPALHRDSDRENMAKKQGSASIFSYQSFPLPFFADMFIYGNTATGNNKAGK